MVLSGYGFSLFDVADASPHTAKTKKACAMAVSEILKDRKMLDIMRKKHTLPMKELSKRSGISKKVLDRHRRYIIAAAEILNGEYPLMCEYLRFIKSEVQA